jgi:hypothetical protein
MAEAMQRCSSSLRTSPSPRGCEPGKRMCSAGGIRRLRRRVVASRDRLWRQHGVVGSSHVQCGDGVAEVAVGIELLTTAVLDDGGDGGSALTAGGRAEEEPVLAPRWPTVAFSAGLLSMGSQPWSR